MVIGDARLTLARETKPFDLIMIDAFASDAIPVHLLTRQAVAMYLTKLTTEGLLVMHISNRHLELESVAAAIAADLGLEGVAKLDRVTEEEILKAGKAGSRAVVLSRSKKALEPLNSAEGWKPLKHIGTTAWTDDYSNIVGAMWRSHTD